MCPRERGAGASVATTAGEQPRPVSENVQLPKMLRSKGHAPVAAWSHGVRLWGRGSSAPCPIQPHSRRSAPPGWVLGRSPCESCRESRRSIERGGGEAESGRAQARGRERVCAAAAPLFALLSSFLPSWLPPTFPQLVIAKGSPLPRLSLVRAFAGSKRRLGAEGLGTEGLCERGRGVPCPALETRTGPGGCEAVG